MRMCLGNHKKSLENCVMTESGEPIKSEVTQRIRSWNLSLADKFISYFSCNTCFYFLLLVQNYKPFESFGLLHNFLHLLVVLPQNSFPTPDIFNHSVEQSQPLPTDFPFPLENTIFVFPPNNTLLSCLPSTIRCTCPTLRILLAHIIPIIYRPLH